MKKLSAILLSAALILTLCSCSGNGPSESSAAEGENTSVLSEASAASSELSKASKAESKDASGQEASKKESSEKASKEASKESSKESPKKASEPSEESSKEPSEEPSSEQPVQESSEPSQQTAEPSVEPSVVSQPEPSIVPESSTAPQPSSEPVSESPQIQSSVEESSIQPEPSKPKIPSNGSPVDAGWFDDALFVGDSVTLKLSYYADNGSLGNAGFLCAGSLGWNNALWDINRPDNVHPSYNGVKYTVDEGARIINPNKIFIMLGMNDIGLYGVDGAINGMKQLLARIEQKCPDAEIYIESVTPMLQNMQLRDLNNRTIAEFDRKAQAYCQEKGYHYLDIASAVEDGSGNLIYSYCSDPSAMGLHFSNEGCYQWVEYLKNHV